MSDFIEETGTSCSPQIETPTQEGLLSLPVVCPRCKQALSTEAVLASAVRYWPQLNIASNCRFPCCGSMHDVEFSLNKISLGYTYAAGTVHFCGMRDYEVLGLTVTTSPKGLEIQYEGKRFSVLNKA